MPWKRHAKHTGPYNVRSRHVASAREYPPTVPWNYPAALSCDNCPAAIQLTRLCRRCRRRRRCSSSSSPSPHEVLRRAAVIMDSARVSSFVAVGHEDKTVYRKGARVVALLGCTLCRSVLLEWTKCQVAIMFCSIDGYRIVMTSKSFNAGCVSVRGRKAGRLTCVASRRRFIPCKCRV